MTIAVKFFAALREQVGRDCIDIVVGERGDIAGLLANIREMLGDGAFVALSAPNVRVAVNKEFVDRDAAVRDGDEVAFMPPITGG